MLDGFDVLAISFTAPADRARMNVEPATLGILLSAGLAGMGLGALFISPVADIIGRRAVVILSTLLMKRRHARLRRHGNVGSFPLAVS